MFFNPLNFNFFTKVEFFLFLNKHKLNQNLHILNNEHQKKTEINVL